uniref:Uncharacterized protein n=1 Tax=Peronospora matthiolae TaxID=2874970 RepID=A0AAV1UHB3_9STRA
MHVMIPRPETPWKAVGRSSGDALDVRYSMIILVSGCSLPGSADPAKRMSFLDRADDGAAFEGSPPLIDMPCSAPTPILTMTAVNVASLNAHGQAISSVGIPELDANMNSLSVDGIKLDGTNHLKKTSDELG